MEKMSVYMPADLKARLRAAAKRERRPEAELVRDAAERYVAQLEATLRPASWGRFQPIETCRDDEATLDAGFGAYIRRHR